MTTKHAVLFAMLVAMLTFGCQERVPIGEGEQLPAEQDATTPMVCDPGRQVECACLGGDKGAQVCADDGSKFEPCQCPVEPEAGADAESESVKCSGTFDPGTVMSTVCGPSGQQEGCTVCLLNGTWSPCYLCGTSLIDAGADVGTDAPSNSAAYCDPLDWDPQKAYMGCCGTFTKVNPSDLKAGNLIKASGIHSVYYFGSDGKRYLFPTTIELDSWYAPIDYTYLPAHDYNQICLSVLEITEQQLANIPIGAQQVTRRPGAHVIGITTDPKRYVVDTHRVLRWASPQILEQIYGGPVDVRTFLTPDAFFVNYLMGASISSASEYPFVTRYTEADIEVELGIKP